MTDSNKPTSAPNASSNGSRNEDEIDLGKLFGLLLDRKWFIIIITVLFMALGVAYALLATPVYKADALLQVEKKSSGMPALSGDMADMFAKESEAETEIQIMTSRMVIGEVVDQLDLTILSRPRYTPIIGEFLARRSGNKDEVLISELQVPQSVIGKPLRLDLNGKQLALYFDDQQVISGAIGEEMRSGEWRLKVADIEAHNTDTFEVYKTSRLGTINTWKERLSVSERGKDTGILAASLQHTDGTQAKEVLQAITQAYMLQNIRRNAAEAQNSLEFIEQQLPSLKHDLTVAEEKLNQYRLQSQSVDLSLETKGMLDQVIEYEKRLNELSFKEAELARLYTREHPQYQALLEQKQRLQQEKAELTKQIEQLPETQQEVLRLTRDVEVNQEIYLQLLNRMQELNVMKAGTVGNVRILDEAVTQPRAVAPKKPLIVVLATMLGGMVSVGWVFVQAMMNRGVQSPEELENAGITVYASIPDSEVQHKLEERIKAALKRDKNRHAELPLLAAEEPTDMSIEALRGLRTSLHFAMLEAKNNIIMISGPSPTVGKSFITANLAMVLAQAGKRVLIIDVDLRRGYLHNMMDLNNKEGLSDYLAGKVDRDALIKQTPYKGVDMVNRGVAPPNPSELLMQARLQELFDYASEHYDYVLCDTPPILAVTDAAIVGRYAGTNLLVTGFEQNSVKEVEQTIKRFAQNGVTIKGTLLNKVRRTRSSYYGYGYGYGYGYEYKSK
ncbi:polysaccharide biosynthesis tyrosine autokinase [Idiomarina sp. UBA3162]|uniref:polysaccharide biosynthesis tyrosine autokinase n=1 Tax=Idiomarina sp. UBA3162 TaxID=1946641 RepID=UPI000C9543AB|nr:polysaccharide biosynthesis tyrosine autokinase [Idiomarina sp. UBA3162]MAD54272.1 tyrosine-protein kinase [Idiomarinaceae bacterium]